MNCNCRLFKYSIIIGIFSFYSVDAQELPPLEYYVDENENLFWPRSKPVYLFVNDEKDLETANPLKSQSTPDLANPFYLPNEGLNLLKSRYAVKDGKVVQPPTEVVFEIYGDGIPPKTQVAFRAPTFKSSGRIFYGKNLTIESTARDTTSGVKATYYSYSGESFVTSTGSFSPINDGINDFRIYSLDQVNNAESIQTFTFEIDITAPETKHAISGEFRGRVLSPRVEIELNPIDRGSGVKAAYYSLNNESDQLYTQPLSLANLPDGSHILTYYSVDQVKNQEDPIKFEFYLDRNPPLVEVKIVGDQYQNRGRMFISDRTNIEFTASDNRAGVKRIFYRIDDGEEKIYSEPFLLEKGTGSHVIKYYAVDQVGNGLTGEFSEANGGRKGLDIDMNAPFIFETFEGRTIRFRDTTFIRADTKVMLSANDVESGIKKLGYKVNGGSGLDYKEPLSFEKEDFYILDYYATDYVNNRNSKEISFKVDNTGPAISWNFSSRSTQTKYIEGDTLRVFQTGVRLYLQATDLGTDVEDIVYSINGSPPVPYAKPLALSKLGKNTIQVSATDRLGNRSKSEEIEIYLQN